MRNQEIKAVLLDMGGVILHMAGGRGFPLSKLDWRGRQAMLRSIRQAGGRVELENLEEWVFTPWHQDYLRRADLGREADWSPHLDRLRSRTGCLLRDVDLLAAWFGPYGDQLQPLEGVAGALRALRRAGMPLALVSNVPLPGELYRRVLDRYSLAGYFEFLVFSYDVGSRKPSPAMLRRAMSALGAHPSEAVMVGDRRDRDIVAGRSAGTRTVWLRTDDGGGPDPDQTIDSLAELPDLLIPRGR